MSKPDKKAANQKPGKIVLLPVEQIEPSPFQARTAFDETEIAALAVSILQNGLLQPISVRKTGYHKYQLVAGERRLRACRLAKLERIPAIIQDFDDSETAALGLLENLQRAQLDAFDAARGIREVIRLWNCTQAEAARRLGLSQPALANKLRFTYPDHRPAAALHRCRSDRAPRPRCTAPAGKPPHRRAGKDRTGQAECAGSRPSGGRHAGCPQRHPRPLPQHGADGGGCAAVCKHLTARG